MNRSTQNRLLHALLCIGLTTLTTSAVMGQGTGKWGGEFRMQMGLGGDELADISYSDGSTSSLTLGKYFSFVAGPIYSISLTGKRAIELQGLIGYAGWSTGPEDTDDRVALKRMPVEVLAFYRFPIVKDDMYLRFGAGATYHFVGGIKGSGSLSGVDLGVTSAPGGIVEATFIQGIISAGLRYTVMNNEVDGLGSMSGSSFAGFLGIGLPR